MDWIYRAKEMHVLHTYMMVGTRTPPYVYRFRKYQLKANCPVSM